MPPRHVPRSPTPLSRNPKRLDTAWLCSSRQIDRIALLRAFGDEALRRYAATGAKGIVMVRSEHSMQKWKNGEGQEDDWIGWPRREVYEYDPQVFAELTRLFQSGKKNELRQTWEGHKRLSL